MTPFDFSWLLHRLGRKADSPTGRALRLVFMDGAPVAQAAKLVPLVRLRPVLAQAQGLADSLTVPPSPGMTQEQADALLRAARIKEMAPIDPLAVLMAAGGAALKGPGHDGLPDVTMSQLWRLQEAGQVRVTAAGDGVFLWEVGK